MDETDLGGFPFQNLKPREDGLNCFCYAGVLIAEEDIEVIRRNYKAFCEKWGIDYPLHYNGIRGKTGNFKWLREVESNASIGNRMPSQVFIDEYHEFMTDQPYKIFATSIDKFFFEEAHKHYQLKMLFLEIRTAALLSMLAELAAHLRAESITADIYFEEAGRKEDKALMECVEKFKNVNFPSYHKTVLPNLAQGVNKTNPFTQIADFCAYPIAKTRHDKTYRPFVLLSEKGKLGEINYTKYPLKE